MCLFETKCLLPGTFRPKINWNLDICLFSFRKAPCSVIMYWKLDGSQQLEGYKPPSKCHKVVILKLQDARLLKEQINTIGTESFKKEKTLDFPKKNIKQALHSFILQKMSMEYIPLLFMLLGCHLMKAGKGMDARRRQRWGLAGQSWIELLSSSATTPGSRCQPEEFCSQPPWNSLQNCRMLRVSSKLC